MNAPRGTACRLSSPGRSAIAVIRIEGDLEALDEPAALFSPKRGGPHEGATVASLPVNAIRFGRWGDYGEEVVLCRISKQAVEITCHGGEAAVAKIMSDLAARGVESRSAKLLDAADGEALLIRAPTQRTAEILLHQVALRSSQPQMGNTERIRDASELTLGHLQEEYWTEFGRHLVEPWDVVLCGRPNVGKSSLMNAIAGFTRSIVSEIAGTTRDLVTLNTAIDGWPVRITDTAGVRATFDSIEREGVARTLSSIETADLVIVLLDRSQPMQDEDRQLLNLPTRRRLVVFNKSDLPSVVHGEAEIPFHDPISNESDEGEFGKGLSVSAVTGQGMKELLATIAKTLVPAVPPEDKVIRLPLLPACGS